MNQQDQEFIKRVAISFCRNSINLDVFHIGKDEQISSFKEKLSTFKSSEAQILFSDEVMLYLEKELKEHRDKAHKGEKGENCKYEDTGEELLYYIRQEASEIQGKEAIASPKVFTIPPNNINSSKVALIFPFGLTDTYHCLRDVCASLNLVCVKANDFPNSKAFMQNVFEMIYTCRVAICDFTGCNGNVLYETGIAHTLGREVIIITQSMEDVPTDLKHLNMVVYQNTKEGYQDLSNELKKRLETIFLQ